MGKPLKLLIVEDSEDDALLIINKLKREGYDVTSERVDTTESMNNALDKNVWDVVIADYSMPHFSGLSALNLLKEKKLDLPFILISGKVSEEVAVEAMKAGAHDYLLKDRLTRLVPAIERELQDASSRLSHKKSEERLLELASIVELSNDAIIGKTLDGIITTWNKGAERIFGYTANEVIGKPLLNFIPPEQINEELEIVEKLKRGECIENYETIRMKKDGTKIYVSLTISPIKNAAGQIIGASKIIRDITEQKQWIETLKQKTLELEHSNQELEQFAYVTSHDLQEPLRKIISFGDLLKREYSNAIDEKGKNYIRRMDNAAIRMKQLIESILELSRISRNMVAYEKVNLNNLIREIKLDLEIEISKTKATIQTNSLPSIIGEKIQFKQLFQNLISNALKYQKQDINPEIFIDSTITENKFLEIIVRDNGIGFDEKYINKIFKPFQRLHTRDEYEGSGMGLTICQKIVLLYNGNITAKSAPGKGTTFVINLPSNIIALEHK